MHSPYLNVYEKASTKSNLSSQILYGEKFQVIQKKKNFLKVRTIYDKYVGFIKVGKFNKKMNQTHKVSVLKSKIYSKPLRRFGTKKFLPFSSEIEFLEKKNNFVKFEKNKWVNFNELEIIKKRNIDFTKILKLFLGCKYKWGGKSFDGIDCSAYYKYFINLIISFLEYIDQVKLKRNCKKKFSKRRYYFWKGHVTGN